MKETSDRAAVVAATRVALRNGACRPRSLIRLADPANNQRDTNELPLHSHWQVCADHLHARAPCASRRPGVVDRRTQHAFRPTRGARGVPHRVAGERVVELGGRERVHQLVVVTEAGDCTSDGETPLGRDRHARRHGDVGEARVRHQQLGIGVLDDVAGVVRGPAPAHRGEPPARPHRAAIGPQELGHVGQQRGNGGTHVEADRIERPRETVRARLHIGVAGERMRYRRHCGLAAPRVRVEMHPTTAHVMAQGNIDERT